MSKIEAIISIVGAALDLAARKKMIEQKVKQRGSKMPRKSNVVIVQVELTFDGQDLKIAKKWWKANGYRPTDDTDILVQAALAGVIRPSIGEILEL